MTKYSATNRSDSPNIPQLQSRPVLARKTVKPIDGRQKNAEKGVS